MQKNATFEDDLVRIARSSGTVSTSDEARWLYIHGLLRAFFADGVFEAEGTPERLKISALSSQDETRVVRVFTSSGATPLYSAVWVRKPDVLAQLAPLIDAATQGDRDLLWEIFGPAHAPSAHVRLALSASLPAAGPVADIVPVENGFDFTESRGGA